MEIKVVDLGCEKCHKKIKRVLCAIPQIQNQIYDKKENTVTITVVCCCPEKIKKKIYCKGGRTVKCVKIPPPPPTPPTTTPPASPPTVICVKIPPPVICVKIPPPPTTPPPCTCTCCEKCRRGPCCHHFCTPTVPPYCPVPCRRAVCDIWEDGCCSCRSRGYSVCRSLYVYEEYYPPTCKIM
ncbi:protein PYRICULARIA ORYZAE RESISTANCE 21-like isoform X3 [Populus nigra]|nr:protein PYRICULARIA ORYZAE RESISTANCE 21-like isoform X3 [Populus nigra]